MYACGSDWFLSNSWLRMNVEISICYQKKVNEPALLVIKYKTLRDLSGRVCMRVMKSWVDQVDLVHGRVLTLVVYAGENEMN